MICRVMGWMHNASVAMLPLLAKLCKRENIGETFTFMNRTVHCKHRPQLYHGTFFNHTSSFPFHWAAGLFACLKHKLISPVDFLVAEILLGVVLAFTCHQLKVKMATIQVTTHWHADSFCHCSYYLQWKTKLGASSCPFIIEASEND